MARERADTVPVLDCQSCGALTPGERFRYYGDQIVCDACDERNPQTLRRFGAPSASPAPRYSGEVRAGPQSRVAGYDPRLPHYARPSTTYPERGDHVSTAHLSRRHARAACRVR
jgi:hypothetical protein